MHYTEGWANGFKYDIEYWEIWNEPDLDPEDSTNKRCWGGTEEQFAEFYTVVSKHLKGRFPHLKIGGPAIAGNEEWLERTKKEKSPMDFISWHWYWTQPYDMSLKGTRIRAICDKYGYKDSESILNEWNYVRGWTDEFVYSIEQVIGMKGTAFTAACMSAAQHNPAIDMLMYYDARPTGFNGLFDFYTYRPLKGYYPFLIYSKLYKLGQHCVSETDDEDIYAVLATDEKSIAAMITYYAEDYNKNAKTVELDFGSIDMTDAKIQLLDKDNTMAFVCKATIDGGKIKIRLERNSVLFIEK